MEKHHMPNQLEQLMDNIIAGNVNDIKLNKILDGMFINWNKDKPERHGLHLSDVKEPLKGVNQFCYRKHVLSASYKEVDIESGYISVSQLRVFLEGWYIHMKWQTLFKKSGKALE